MATPLKVVIVGAGIGGLVCAIACRQQGLDVLVLEKAAEILPVGAGIQVPPNATRVCRRLGVLDKLKEYGIVLDSTCVRRYQTGEQLCIRPLGQRMLDLYGSPWMVVHRADYHRVLMEECERLLVDIRKDADVTDINFEKTQIILKNGEVITSDAIVGADGLWSTIRERVLEMPSPPLPTGDLAYRGTFTAEQLKALGDSRIDQLCAKRSVTVWFGPGGHAVFYPVKGGKEFNLVLLRPDNLAPDARTEQGDIGELRASFRGWDDILTKIISCVSSTLKWKLLHHEELRTWTKNRVALLGDACHPTLPYQAQGAAMAVEDGAVLGVLLGGLNRSGLDRPAQYIADVLRLYENLQKTRSTTNVKGAIANQHMYHLPDGPEQQARDAELKRADFVHSSTLLWADPKYQRSLLGFDCVAAAETAFDGWVKEASQRPLSSSL